MGIKIFAGYNLAKFIFNLTSFMDREKTVVGALFFQPVKFPVPLIWTEFLKHDRINAGYIKNYHLEGNMVRKVLVIAIITTSFPCYAEDWQTTLEGQFQVVETFDRLDDWRGANSVSGYDMSQSNMPVETDGGTASIWNFYSDYTSGNATDDWIKNHGSSSVWGGTGKSLKMDLTQNATTPQGPSRFGLYFGSSTEDGINPYASSGVANSGFKEVYYFYMVKLPNNMFPTDSGGIWPNDSYKWWSYHKFNTMSAGFLSISQDDSSAGGAGGCRWEYGCSYVLSEMKQCGSVCSGAEEDTFTPSHDIRIVDYTNSSQTWTQDDVVLKTAQGGTYMNQAAADGEWFGIEYHIDPGTPGVANGSIDTWMYEEDGTAHLIHSSSGIMVMQSGTDLNYNKFFFGGNISYQADANSQGLDTTYYVDDFIMDDQRIGPTYFTMLSGQQVDSGAETDSRPEIQSIESN